MRQGRILVSLGTALLVVLCIALGAFLFPKSQDAEAGTVTGRNRTDYSTTPIVADVTATTLPIDVTWYDNVQVFAVLDQDANPKATAITMEYTIQFSSDGNHWVNAKKENLNASATPIAETVKGSLDYDDTTSYKTTKAAGRFMRVLYSTSGVTGTLRPKLSVELTND